MALNNLGLGFVFTARDLASGTLHRLEQRFRSLDERVTGGTARMTGAFRRLGIGLAVFTAGAVAVAGALSLANAAGQFEQGLAAVGAVTRATAREMRMLRNAAIEAGMRTQFSPAEAVEGLQALATAGQTAEQSTRTLIPVLDLAAGSLGQLGVAQSAEAVVGTLNAYGMAAEEAAGVTDKLLRITQLTNFQTRDFEAGLSKAAATGAVFGQHLDDVLITMGLLRNRNIDASSSATAFRESVRRVGAENRAMQAITGAGVDVFDRSSGRMRSIIDIMNDFARATESMTEKERNRRVVTAFGARGLLAFNAILEASFTTMRDGEQVTLRGADAIEALRQQMAGAQGTAAQFREQLLDTFQGQKTLLGGMLQTLAVVLGEPFAKLFKPVVAAVVDGLNALLRAFQAIPEPIKRVFAGVVVAVGSFFMLVGGVIAAKASIALLAIAMKALGISLGGIIAIMLPAVLVVAVLGAAVAGFVIAFKKNLGGIADFARRVWGQMTLFVRGLMQLFEQGGFSGAVREELNRAEHQGLKRFLISVWQVLYRIQQVWQGFKDGFIRTIEEARPVFEDLVDALAELGQEIAAVFTGVAGKAASLPSAEFRSFGEAAGAAVATAVRWLTRLLAIFVRITSGIVSGFRSMMGYIGPAFEAVREALSRLGAAWDALLGRTRDSSAAVKETTSSWRALGEFLGKVIGGIITTLILVIATLLDVLTAVIWVVTQVKDAFVIAGTAIGETLATVYRLFTETLPNALSSGWDAVVGFVRRIGQFFVGIGRWFALLFDTIASSVKNFFSPVIEFFYGVGQTIKNVINGIYDFVIKLLRRIPDTFLPESLEKLKRQPLSTEVRTEDKFEATSRTHASAYRAEAATSSMPAAAAMRGQSSDLAQLEANLMAYANAQARSQGQPPPFQIHVQVDGETIARATHNANSEAAARAFSPLPTY